MPQQLLDLSKVAYLLTMLKIYGGDTIGYWINDEGGLTLQSIVSILCLRQDSDQTLLKMESKYYM